MTHSFLSRCMPSLVFVLANAGALRGQVETGLIVGGVTDPAGAIVPAARITIKSEIDLNPAQYTFWNAGRGIVGGPGTRNFDFSLFRNFYLAKGDSPKQLQLRGEMFNITNTPQFNNPNATIGVANTGIIAAAGSPSSFQRIQRQIQIAVRFLF